MVAAVLADRRLLAPDGGGLHGVDDPVDGVGRHLDESEPVEDPDGTDVVASQVRLAGDGTHQVLRSHAVTAAGPDVEA